MVSAFLQEIRAKKLTRQATFAGTAYRVMYPQSWWS
jgi:hypothetical protein